MRIKKIFGSPPTIRPTTRAIPRSTAVGNAYDYAMVLAQRRGGF